MPNRIELPEELQAMIEKREGEERRQSDDSDLSATENERRSGEDRRMEEHRSQP